MGRPLLLRCEAQFSIRDVLGCGPRPEDKIHEATGVRHASRRRGDVAVCSTRAAAHASGRVPITLYAMFQLLPERQNVAGEPVMLDWLANLLLNAGAAVASWIISKDAPNFAVIQMMAATLVLATVVFVLGFLQWLVWKLFWRPRK
jgi:hypothetical protein